MHAAPVAAPGPKQWPALSPENAEYLHVTVTGHFLAGRDTLVRATTELGGGYWVMAPLQADAGFVVLINRGFVTPEQTHYASPETGSRVTVTGLLRMTEKGGGFLRKNAPGQERWYSRDVAAIAHSRQISMVSPYFIDAQASPRPPPVGGLTVVAFRNTHLSYAFTWVALAAMCVAAGVRATLDR